MKFAILGVAILSALACAPVSANDILENNVNTTTSHSTTLSTVTTLSWPTATTLPRDTTGPNYYCEFHKHVGSDGFIIKGKHWPEGTVGENGEHFKKKVALCGLKKWKFVRKEQVSPYDGWTDEFAWEAEIETDAQKQGCVSSVIAWQISTAWGIKGSDPSLKNICTC